MTAIDPASTPGRSPAEGRAGGRSAWRAVAVPSEHGGWGLTLEPAVLGLAVAPSGPGALLAVAAVVAFLARTPLKLALVDRWRGRRLPRTRLAERVAGVEVAALGALVALATMTGDGRFWIAVGIAAPLVGVELWFDMRSRSRRLVPELAGAVGIGAVATTIVLVDGGSWGRALGLWAIMAGRAATSIPFVRSQVARLHGRSVSATPVRVGDAVALGAAAGAWALDGPLVAGAAAVVAVVVFQRLTVARPVPRATVLGVRQMLLGFGVVLVTALGVGLG
jgi:hypothetical protein